MPENLANIGKYHIIELVGEGAMGVVYRAKDSVLDRTVAIKVMNESIARQDDLRKRFLHEAQAAASLQHPNVVCIYDLGDADGHLFIAMEFIQGVDLEKLLEMGEPLALQARLDIVIDVLTGLTFAHKRGIVHRDIKPANIRVTEEGRAKIMDFGVAHLASSSMTSTGSILGTPSFMAPEQITEGKTSAQTDIFAVGGVLYQLLTNMRPFDGPTLQNLFFRIITEKPKSVSDLVPGLPPALDRIVAKAMAKEPADRYKTALEMANELSAVRSKLSGPSYPASVSLSASVSSAIEQAKKKSDTRTRNFAFAGAGAAVALVILIGWSQIVRSRSTPTVAVAQTSPAASTVTPTVQSANPTVGPSSQSVASAPPVAAPSAKPEKSTTTTRETRTAPKSTPSKTAAPKTVERQAQTQTQTKAVSAPPIVQAPVQNPVVQQIVTAKTPPVTLPAVDKTQEIPAPPPSPATAADISPVVQAYARAIESKDIDVVRRAYPGLSSAQQRSLETFFQSARSINARLRLANLEGLPNSAEARVLGTYEFVNSDGRNESRDVNFGISLRREGSTWRLVSVH